MLRVNNLILSLYLYIRLVTQLAYLRFLYTISFLFAVKKPTMDVVTSFLVVVQVLFFTQHVPLYHVSGQPLYKNPRPDSLKDSEAYFNYQKIYGTECVYYVAQINRMQWHEIYISQLLSEFRYMYMQTSLPICFCFKTWFMFSGPLTI